MIRSEVDLLWPLSLSTKWYFGELAPIITAGGPLQVHMQCPIYALFESRKRF